MSTTSITITYPHPDGEEDYDEFSIDLHWQSAEPDVGFMRDYVEDWEFSSDDDKKQYDKIIADGVDKAALDTFIESEVSEAEPD